MQSLVRRNGLGETALQGALGNERDRRGDMCSTIVICAICVPTNACYSVAVE